MRNKVAVGIMVLVMSGALAAPAMAEERVCRGAIGAVTVDNLRVPSDSTCALSGTYVKGTIKVERGATLHASAVRVIGNVQGEGAARVNVVNSSQVGGSVQVKQGGAARVADSRINADIQFDSQRGELIASSNVVGGNIQAMKNTGGVAISHNRVDGNLQCKENRPAPTGGGNIVNGNKEDQCSRL
ncbi:MAG TPA: hypothetical protein VM754_03610 [Actinomycetota bacterium]|nr:hypothetical protein [Actinomycetota bacterium]